MEAATDEALRQGVLLSEGAKDILRRSNEPPRRRRLAVVLIMVLGLAATASIHPASGSVASTTLVDTPTLGPVGQPTKVLGLESSGQLLPVVGFGSNPGNLLMFEWIPKDLPANAPVVVFLHGCLSVASMYDDETGLAELADRWKFAVIFPQQLPTNQPTNCFSWHDPEHLTRGQGEPLSITQMVDWMHANRGTDPDRTYVMGFSGGGYFTSVMLATYPDVFKAGASVAGGPYRCGGQEECSNGTVEKTAEEWGDLARSGYPGYAGPKPPISIWHGTTDTTVDVRNLDHMVAQWTNYHGIDQTPDVDQTVKGYPHRVYANAEGTPLVETYTLTGRAHLWPIEAGDAPEQCNGTLPGSDVGICAAYHIGTWFGLDQTPDEPPDEPRRPPACDRDDNRSRRAPQQPAVCRDR